MLTAAVLDALGDVDGATVLDLYSGAGLFTLPLADAVGPTGEVVAVEGDPRAVRDARRNSHDRSNIELHQGDVARVLTGDDDPSSSVVHADVVVLDPPRVGAGATWWSSRSPSCVPNGSSTWRATRPRSPGTSPTWPSRGTR